MNPPRWRIRSVDVTASTNDDARLAAEAGEAEGLVIVANRQSSGRGRQGRVWESPPGNLYCSILLRPRAMPKVAGHYSFVAALAVYDAISACAPSKTTRLKWPNDILVEGKKISGILLEVSGDALIVGIGINVEHYPENALYPATSLKVEGQAHLNSLEVLDTLLPRFWYWHDLLQSEGFEPIRTAWLEHAKQGELIVKLPHETVTGIFAGLTEAGHLRLRLADGAERSISTGDVVLPTKD